MFENFDNKTYEVIQYGSVLFTHSMSKQHLRVCLESEAMERTVQELFSNLRNGGHFFNLVLLANELVISEIVKLACKELEFVVMNAKNPFEVCRVVL